MALFRDLRPIILIISYVSLYVCNVNCTEYVPVFMWESSSYPHAVKEIPALATLSADELKDIVLQKAETKSVIVVFAEENLSVEDFSWQDEAGGGSFPNLENISHSSGGLTYLPFVHAPLHAFRHRLTLHGRDWYHLKLGPDGLSKDAAAWNETLLFVNLDDASSNEDRPDLLRRHDAQISRVFNMLAERHEDVLAIYTAHHSSWHSGEETMTRRVRRLLQAAPDEEPGKYFGNNTILFAPNITFKNTDLGPGEIQSDNASSLVLKFTDKATITFEFDESFGYWSLSEVIVVQDNDEVKIIPKNIGAPMKFSYHCTNVHMFGENEELVINKLQVQRLSGNSEDNKSFGEAYDCIYFFTVPIWSGLFICSIFSVIMAFGLCMIMDIKTMDRFDDPKGKTITINVAE